MRFAFLQIGKSLAKVYVHGNGHYNDKPAQGLLLVPRIEPAGNP
jgi:hypothetical protein